MNFLRKHIRFQFLSTFFFFISFLFGIFLSVSIDSESENSIALWIPKLILITLSEMSGDPVFDGDLSIVLQVALANALLVVGYSVVLLILMSLYRIDGSSPKMMWIDSVYFLGFILTLTSLITALGSYQGVNNSGGVESVGSSITLIVVQNAIALSSTVVALVIRTIWKLLLVESPANYKNTHLALVDELKRFSDKFSDASIQVEGSLSRIERSTGRAGGQMNRISNELSSVEIPKDVIAKKITEMFRETADALTGEISHLAAGIGEKNVEYLNAIDVSIDRIKQFDIKDSVESALIGTFDPVKGSFEKGARDIDDTLGSFDNSLQRMNSSLSTVASEMANIGTLIENDRGRIPEMSHIVSEICEELRAFSSELSEIKNTNLRFGESSENIRALSERLGELETPMRQFASTLDVTSTETRQAGEEIRGVVNQVSDAFAVAINKINNAARQ